MSSKRYLRCLVTWPRVFHDDKRILKLILDCFQDINGYVIGQEMLDCHAYIEFKLGSCPREQLRTLSQMWLGSKAFDYQQVTRRLDTVLAYVTKQDHQPLVYNVSPKHFSTRYHLYQCLETTSPHCRHYYVYYINNATLRELVREVDKTNIPDTAENYKSWLTLNRMLAQLKAGVPTNREAIADAAWAKGRQWSEDLLTHQCSPPDPGQEKSSLLRSLLRQPSSR